MSDHDDETPVEEFNDVACVESELLVLPTDEFQSVIEEVEELTDQSIRSLASVSLRPLLRVIRLGTVGDDVICAKRCLARAGHGTLSGITPLAGVFMVTHIKNFQRSKGLMRDGQVGPVTWSYLQKYADARAWYYYNKQKEKQEHHTPPVVMGSLRLPQYFRATHQTAGLSGYPAIDVMGSPWRTFGAPENGRVIRLSGKSPALGGRPGSAYGWTTYLRGDSGAIYFLTHQAYRSIVLGQRVIKGQKMGAIADARVAHMSSSLSHIHEGKHS